MRERIRNHSRIVGLRNRKLELLHMEVNKNEDEIDLAEKIRN